MTNEPHQTKEEMKNSILREFREKYACCSHPLEGVTWLSSALDRIAASAKERTRAEDVAACIKIAKNQYGPNQEVNAGIATVIKRIRLYGPKVGSGEEETKT